MNKISYGIVHNSSSISSVLTDFFTSIGWVNLGNQTYNGINHIGFTNNTWSLYINLDMYFKVRLSGLTTNNSYIDASYPYYSGNAFLPLSDSESTVNFTFYYDNKKIIIANENPFLNVNSDVIYSSNIQYNHWNYRFLIFYTWQDANNYYALLSNDPFYPYSYNVNADIFDAFTYPNINRRLKMIFGIKDKNNPSNITYLYNLPSSDIISFNNYNPHLFDKIFYSFMGRATFTDKFLVSNLYLYVRNQNNENFFLMDDDILYCVFENIPSNEDFLVKVGNNFYKAYRLQVTGNQDCLLIKHV